MATQHVPPGHIPLTLADAKRKLTAIETSVGTDSIDLTTYLNQIRDYFTEYNNLHADVASYFLAESLPKILKSVLKRKYAANDVQIAGTAGFLTCAVAFLQQHLDCKVESVFAVLADLLDPTQSFYAKYGIPKPAVIAHATAAAAATAVMIEAPDYVKELEIGSCLDCKNSKGEWELAVLIEKGAFHEIKMQFLLTYEEAWISDDYEDKCAPYSTKTGVAHVNDENTDPEKSKAEAAAATAATTTGGGSLAAVEVMEMEEEDTTWKTIIKPGCLVDAKDNTNVWFQACVMDVKTVDVLVVETAVAAAVSANDVAVSIASDAAIPMQLLTASEVVKMVVDDDSTEGNGSSSNSGVVAVAEVIENKPLAPSGTEKDKENAMDTSSSSTELHDSSTFVNLSCDSEVGDVSGEVGKKDSSMFGGGGGGGGDGDTSALMDISVGEVGSETPSFKYVARIAYIGFSERYDEWIDFDCNRIAAFNTKSGGRRGEMTTIREEILHLIPHLEIITEEKQSEHENELFRQEKIAILRPHFFLSPNYIDVVEAFGFDGVKAILAFLFSFGKQDGERPPISLALHLIVALGNMDQALLHPFLKKLTPPYIESSKNILTNMTPMDIRNTPIESVEAAIRSVENIATAIYGPTSQMGEQVERLWLDVPLNYVLSNILNRRLGGLKALTETLRRAQNKGVFDNDLNKVVTTTNGVENISYRVVPSMQFLSFQDVCTELLQKQALCGLFRVATAHHSLMERSTEILKALAAHNLLDEALRKDIWEAACVRHENAALQALIDIIAFMEPSGLASLLSDSVDTVDSSSVSISLVDMVAAVALRSRSILLTLAPVPVEVANSPSSPSSRLSSSSKQASSPSSSPRPSSEQIRERVDLAMDVHSQALKKLFSWAGDRSGTSEAVATRCLVKIELILTIGIEFNEAIGAGSRFPWDTHWQRSLYILNFAIDALTKKEDITPAIRVLIAVIQSWPMPNALTNNNATANSSSPGSSSSSPRMRSGSSFGLPFARASRPDLSTYLENTYNILQSLTNAAVALKKSFQSYVSSMHASTSSEVTIEREMLFSQEVQDELNAQQGVLSSRMGYKEQLKKIFDFMHMFARFSDKIIIQQSMIADVWTNIVGDAATLEEADVVINFLSQVVKQNVTSPGGSSKGEISSAAALGGGGGEGGEIKSISTVKSNAYCTKEAVSWAFSSLLCNRDGFIKSPLFSTAALNCTEKLFRWLNADASLIVEIKENKGKGGEDKGYVIIGDAASLIGVGVFHEIILSCKLDSVAGAAVKMLTSLPQRLSSANKNAGQQEQVRKMLLTRVMQELADFNSLPVDKRDERVFKRLLMLLHGLIDESAEEAANKVRPHGQPMRGTAVNVKIQISGKQLRHLNNTTISFFVNDTIEALFNAVAKHLSVANPSELKIFNSGKPLNFSQDKKKIFSKVIKGTNLMVTLPTGTSSKTEVTHKPLDFSSITTTTPSSSEVSEPSKPLCANDLAAFLSVVMAKKLNDIRNENPNMSEEMVQAKLKEIMAPLPPAPSSTQDALVSSESSTAMDEQTTILLPPTPPGAVSEVVVATYLPAVALSQSNEYFLLLFALMENSTGSLCNDVWELISRLPTSSDVMTRWLDLSAANIVDILFESQSQEGRQTSLPRLLYDLQIVEVLLQPAVSTDGALELDKAGTPITKELLHEWPTLFFAKGGFEAIAQAHDWIITQLAKFVHAQSTREASHETTELLGITTSLLLQCVSLTSRMIRSFYVRYTAHAIEERGEDKLAALLSTILDKAKPISAHGSIDLSEIALSETSTTTAAEPMIGPVLPAHLSAASPSSSSSPLTITTTAAKSTGTEAGDDTCTTTNTDATPITPCFSEASAQASLKELLKKEWGWRLAPRFASETGNTSNAVHLSMQSSSLVLLSLLRSFGVDKIFDRDAPESKDPGSKLATDEKQDALLNMLTNIVATWGCVVVLCPEALLQLRCDLGDEKGASMDVEGDGGKASGSSALYIPSQVCRTSDSAINLSNLLRYVFLMGVFTNKAYVFPNFAPEYQSSKYFLANKIANASREAFANILHWSSLVSSPASSSDFPSLADALGGEIFRAILRTRPTLSFTPAQFLPANEPLTLEPFFSLASTLLNQADKRVKDRNGVDSGCFSDKKEVCVQIMKELTEASHCWRSAALSRSRKPGTQIGQIFYLDGTLNFLCSMISPESGTAGGGTMRLKVLSKDSAFLSREACEILSELRPMGLEELVLESCLGLVVPSVSSISPEEASQEHMTIPCLCEDEARKASAYTLLLFLCKWRPEIALDIFSIISQTHSRAPPPSSFSYKPEKEVRSRAGYVGLRNMGSTCYMNSLLQMLYMIPSVRQGLLEVPLDPSSAQDVDKQKDDYLLQLQKMFMFLQYSEKKAYSPESWVQSYKDENGVLPVNVMQQQDAQEFFLQICDRLESAVASRTSAASESAEGGSGGGSREEFSYEALCKRNMLRRCFGGIETVLLTEQATPAQIQAKVPLRSKEKCGESEAFWLISVEIKGFTGLEQSLSKYVEEVIISDWEWSDGVDDLHPPRVTLGKRTCIGHMGDVLVFHLKRFELNYETFQREKINDSFAFPLHLNMLPYTKEGLSGEGTPTRPKEYYLYELAGVVVHTGSIDSGHYFSFIKDRKSGEGGSFSSTPSQPPTPAQWFEFNDSEVTEFQESKIESDCFGGMSKDSNGNTVMANPKSAFMLVYQRSTPLNQGTKPSPKQEGAMVSVPAENRQASAVCSNAILEEYLKSVLAENARHSLSVGVFSFSHIIFMRGLLHSVITHSSAYHKRISQQQMTAVGGAVDGALLPSRILSDVVSVTIRLLSRSNYMQAIVELLELQLKCLEKQQAQQQEPVCAMGGGGGGGGSIAMIEEEKTDEQIELEAIALSLRDASAPSSSTSTAMDQDVKVSPEEADYDARLAVFSPLPTLAHETTEAILAPLVAETDMESVTAILYSPESNVRMAFAKIVMKMLNMHMFYEDQCIGMGQGGSIRSALDMSVYFADTVAATKAAALIFSKVADKNGVVTCPELGDFPELSDNDEFVVSEKRSIEMKALDEANRKELFGKAHEYKSDDAILAEAAAASAAASEVDADGDVKMTDDSQNTQAALDSDSGNPTTNIAAASEARKGPFTVSSSSSSATAANGNGQQVEADKMVVVANGDGEVVEQSNWECGVADDVHAAKRLKGEEVGGEEAKQSAPVDTPSSIVEMDTSGIGGGGGGGGLTLNITARFLASLTDSRRIHLLSENWRRSDGILHLLLKLCEGNDAYAVRLFFVKRELVSHLVDIFLVDQSPLCGELYNKGDRRRAPSSYVAVWRIKDNQLCAGAKNLPDWKELLEIVALLVCSCSTQGMHDRMLRAQNTGIHNNAFNDNSPLIPDTLLPSPIDAPRLDIHSQQCVDSRVFYATAVKQSRYAAPLVRIIQHQAFESAKNSDLITEVLFEAVINASMDSCAHLFEILEGLLLVNDSLTLHRLNLIFNGNSLLENMKGLSEQAPRARFLCICIRSLLALVRRVPRIKDILCPQAKIASWAPWMLKFCFQFERKSADEAALAKQTSSIAASATTTTAAQNPATPPSTQDSQTVAVNQEAQVAPLTNQMDAQNNSTLTSATTQTQTQTVTWADTTQQKQQLPPPYAPSATSATAATNTPAKGSFLIVYGEADDERELSWETRAERTKDLLMTILVEMGAQPDALIPEDAFTAQALALETGTGVGTGGAGGVGVGDNFSNVASGNEDEELQKALAMSMVDQGGLDGGTGGVGDIASVQGGSDFMTEEELQLYLASQLD